jgi:hypothetical protein
MDSPSRSVGFLCGPEEGAVDVLHVELIRCLSFAATVCLTRFRAKNPVRNSPVSPCSRYPSQSQSASPIVDWFDFA